MTDRPPAPPGAPPPDAPPPGPAPRPADLVVPLGPDGRARLDRAAAALGLPAPAYARARLLDPGPDQAAWRRAYHLVLDAVHDAHAAGLPDPAADAVDRLQTEFETLAAAVFAGDADGDADAGAGPAPDPAVPRS